VRQGVRELNPQQQAAIAHEGGPLLVVAGAGSGKTLTLACRVAGLIDRGVSPERILLLTFTRRAAREMLARAEQLVGRRIGGRAWGGTFHAIGNRLLRLGGRAISVSPDFTVLDQADTADLLDLIRSDLGLGAGTRRFPRKDTLGAIYSRTVNAGEKLGAVLRRDFPWCEKEADPIRSIFRQYVERKRAQNVLDYDDLLLYWSALMRSPAGERVAGMFDHVLVDEYQDTNALQADILEGLARGTNNITVVGDDAQAIYSFRSATVRNILEFPDRFPGTTVVKLERNYRSTPAILEAANAVIALSPQRHEKTLRSSRPEGARPSLVTCLDEAGQSNAVCRSLLEHRERGTLLRRQAVLFRTGHHSDLLELELASRNIPFVKYGGLKFMEAAHVKDAVALLRILENPHDEVSWFRILQLVDGIGPAGARRLIGELGVGTGGSPIGRLPSVTTDVPRAAAAEMAELTGVLSDCAAGSLGPASELERARTFLEPVIERRYEGAQARVRDLDQLEQLAGRTGSRARFLADLTLDPPTSTSDLAGPPGLDEDYVVLSTIHSAKGGEWDVVHVIHAADGMIPSDMATGNADQIEEERRLFYVALTRARDALYVYFPLRYYRRPRGLEDPHTYAQLTRFLPVAVRERFEERSTFAPSDQDQASELVSAGSPDVATFLDGLWAE
jgi:DNA helicase II / ATP-dependent DNA helicase PcrA